MQRIHGLRVASDRILPGLPEDDWAHPPDVRLEFSNAALEPLRGQGERYRSTASAPAEAALVVFDIAPRVTAFRYGDGTAVDVDLRDEIAVITAVIAPDQTLDDFVAYLYGAVLGFVLRNRGILALHASAVVLDDVAVLLVGTQSSGKSTTAAAMVQRGFPVMSDDLTALDAGANGWNAQPAFDFLRVWPSSEPILYGKSGVLKQLSPGWDKRRLPLSAGQFVSRPTPVGAIYLLSAREDVNAPRIEDVAPRDALLTLLSETYTNYLLDESGRALELSQIGALLDMVRVRRLVPHSDPSRLRALCDLIVTDVRGAR